MFRMYATDLHSYAHLILDLGIAREPILWSLLAYNILTYMTLGWLLYEDPSTHGLFDFHLSSNIIPIVIPI